MVCRRLRGTRHHRWVKNIGSRSPAFDRRRGGAGHGWRGRSARRHRPAPLPFPRASHGRARHGLRGRGRTSAGLVRCLGSALLHAIARGDSQIGLVWVRARTIGARRALAIVVRIVHSGWRVTWTGLSRTSNSIVRIWGNREPVLRAAIGRVMLRDKAWHWSLFLGCGEEIVVLVGVGSGGRLRRACSGVLLDGCLAVVMLLGTARVPACGLTSQYVCLSH